MEARHARVGKAFLLIAFMRLLFAIALLFASHMAFAVSGVLQGSGTVVCDGANLATDLQKGYLVATNEGWYGVLCVTNASFRGMPPEWVANANSAIRLTGCRGFFAGGSCPGTLELKDEDGAFAFVVNNATGDVESWFAKLSGNGTLGCTNRNSHPNQRYVFKDVSDFRGVISCLDFDAPENKLLRVIIGDGSYGSPDDGTITLLSSADAAITDGKVWSASTSHIYGTLSFVGGGSLHGDAVAYAGAILSLTNSTSVQPIVGRLSLKGGSSIHLPASAKFPYKVATSIVKDGEVSLYVGTEEVTEGWFAFDGAICPIFLKSSSVKTNHDSWSNLAWSMRGSYTNETALATAISASANSVVIVDQDATLDLGSVTTRKVTFNVAEGKTLSLVGSLIADEVAINGRGVVACDANDVITATLTGEGTLCYESNVPTFGEGYIVAINDAWSGTLWLKGVEFANLAPYLTLSTNSTLRLTGCRGSFGKGTWLGTLELKDGESGQAAFKVTSGFSGATSAIERLAGGGTLYVMADVANQTYAFTDSSDFSGAIHIEPSKSMHIRVKLLDRMYGIDGDAGDLSLATFKTEAQLKAAGLDFGDGVSVSEALSQRCENGLYAWQNMVLGIAPNACENVKPYVAPVQNSMPTKLSFKLGNCSETDIFTDITTQYQVYEVNPDGSPVEGSGALNSGDPASIGDEVSIDLSGLTSVRYFRIKIVFQ